MFTSGPKATVTSVSAGGMLWLSVKSLHRYKGGGNLEQWVSKFGPQDSAASISPGNWLDMQIFRPPFRHMESETLGVGPSNLCFNKLAKTDSDMP